MVAPAFFSIIGQHVLSFLDKMNLNNKAKTIHGEAN